MTVAKDFQLKQYEALKTKENQMFGAKQKFALKPKICEFKKVSLSFKAFLLY